MRSFPDGRIRLELANRQWRGNSWQLAVMQHEWQPRRALTCWLLPLLLQQPTLATTNSRNNHCNQNQHSGGTDQKIQYHSEPETSMKTASEQQPRALATAAAAATTETTNNCNNQWQPESTLQFNQNQHSVKTIQKILHHSVRSRSSGNRIRAATKGPCYYQLLL